jgi:UDP-2,4-diacetamido-2,4,6-trideoxy-beta-L-altropyranose hydrolase
MNHRKVIFRADGGSTIGMGHFTRTLALAEMLKDDFFCIYATQSPTEYQISEIDQVCRDRIDLPANETHFNVFLNFLKGDEIVVLDNYYFTSEYQHEIKSKGCKLVCIDDMHDKHFVADVIINHAPLSASNYSAAAYTKLLLGFNYALLRQDFLKTGPTRKISKFNHLLICFGGADFNNLTNQTLKSIDKINCIESVTVIVGNAFSNFIELEKLVNKVAKRKQTRVFYNVNASELVKIIREADFAIVPCSTILYEVLSQKIPVITGYYVENQTEISSNIKDKFAHILVIGDLNTIQIEQYHIYKLKEQVHHTGITTLISNNSTGLLLKEFHYLNTEFILDIRKAQIEDVDIYFNWVNDEFVRNNSINNKPIPYEDHVNWFGNKIKNSNSLLFIFEENQRSIGQVRFDKENEDLVIDYSIDKDYRGKNLGKVIMRMALDNICTAEISNETKSLIARVRINNIASARVFESLNFESETTELISNSNYFIYKKKLK